jgi:hypothetical protein
VSLEAALAAFETKVAEAQRSADSLVKDLRRLRKAVGSGHVSDLDRVAAEVAERGRQAQEAASQIPGAWSFDSRSYLERGYLRELQQEAHSQGLTLVERDGRLYCFPVALRLEPREAAVRIGRKRERRLRPKELVRQLAAVQKSKQRFNVQRFLDTLYQVYRRVQGASWVKIDHGPGPVMPLAEIHDMLTLLPGSDYPIEEFGRDLLLLARQRDLRTRDDAVFELVGSTMTKTNVKRINVYDEQGLEVTFIAVRFGRGT